MKIVFVLEHFHPYIGGAEKLFYELATNLAKQDFDITVVTTKFDQNLPSLEIHEGIRIARVKCYNRFGFTFFSLPKIIKYAKECNIIHTTTYNASLPAIIAGKLLNKPVYVTFHEVWGSLWKKLPFISIFEKYSYYFYEKLILRLPFNRFIAVSKFTRTKLIENDIPEEKISLIYNGIDYAVYQKSKSESKEIFTYTFFGRLGISKGLDLLIPAAALFKKSYPNSKLKLIIPKTPVKIYTTIQKLISSLDLGEYIEIHHNLPQSQLTKELLNSDCVVIPSYSEGFCFAAAETVALGLPIISSQQGALEEVISGQFIKMEAMSSKALFTALEKAIQGEWSTTPLRYFPLQDSIKKYEEIYS